MISCSKENNLYYAENELDHSGIQEIQSCEIPEWLYNYVENLELKVLDLEKRIFMRY